MLPPQRAYQNTASNWQIPGRNPGQSMQKDASVLSPPPLSVDSNLMNLVTFAEKHIIFVRWLPPQFPWQTPTVLVIGLIHKALGGRAGESAMWDKLVSRSVPGISLGDIVKNCLVVNQQSNIFFVFYFFLSPPHWCPLWENSSNLTMVFGIYINKMRSDWAEQRTQEH